MKDWQKYLNDHANSELWGFIALDYYNRKKKQGNYEDPSHFIDNLITSLMNAEIDIVNFHNVLFNVCVQLMGNDFTEIIEKSIRLIKNVKKQPTSDQMEMIIFQYRDYGKQDIFRQRLNSLGLVTNGILNKVINEKGRHVAVPEIPTTTQNKDKVYLFYAYSHADERFRKRLEQHLSLLRREGVIEDWHDRKILPGAEIDKEIDENLKKSQIILLLVSANFLDSDYAYNIEMKTALKKHESGEAIVIPVILDHVDWHDAPFGKLNALPRDGTPITSSKWKNQNEAFAEVARGIRTNVKNLKKIIAQQISDYKYEQAEIERITAIKTKEIPNIYEGKNKMERNAQKLLAKAQAISEYLAEAKGKAGIEITEEFYQTQFVKLKSRKNEIVFELQGLLKGRDKEYDDIMSLVLQEDNPTEIQEALIKFTEKKGIKSNILIAMKNNKDKIIELLVRVGLQIIETQFK